ncbi:MAG: hypothetical protein INR72_20300, partial [Williamsia herbipolensis]|nr:hypothetical protein [Williamsia herbipolensis]
MLHQQVRNSGDSELAGAHLEVSSGTMLLTGFSSEAPAGADRPQGLRGRPADTTADCVDGRCALPTIPAGATIDVTVTLTAQDGVTLDQLAQGTADLTLEYGSSTSSASVPLARWVPTVALSFGADGIQAGRSDTLQVTVDSPAGATLPADIGISLPTDRILLRDRTDSCTSSDESFVCPVVGPSAAVDESRQYGAALAIDPLPDAVPATAQITLGRFSVYLDVPVQERGPEIEMTGPYQISAAGARLGSACTPGDGDPSNPTPCATDIPDGAQILWAEAIWAWTADGTEDVTSSPDVTLFTGPDVDSGTPLTLGTPSGITDFDGVAAYRSAPIVLDPAARAALGRGQSNGLGLDAGEGAVGSWTVVVLWSDQSVAASRSVTVDDAITLVGSGDGAALEPGSIVSLLDPSAATSSGGSWLFSWIDDAERTINQVVRLTRGAGIFRVDAAGSFVAEGGDG